MVAMSPIEDNKFQKAVLTLKEGAVAEWSTIKRENTREIKKIPGSPPPPAWATFKKAVLTYECTAIMRVSKKQTMKGRKKILWKCKSGVINCACK